MTRVLVASHSPVVRAGLEALLGSSLALDVVGSGDASPSALSAQVERLRPDVVLLELDQPEDDTGAVPFLTFGRDRAPGTVLLVADADAAWAADALRAGVSAMLPRDAAAGEIIAAVEAAAAGLVVVHRDLADALWPALTAQAARLTAAEAGQQPLTPRETQVLACLAEGLGNKHIAARLHISEHTVKSHVAAVFAKLHAASRAEAVALGARYGLIML